MKKGSRVVGKHMEVTGKEVIGKGVMFDCRTGLPNSEGHLVQEV